MTKLTKILLTYVVSFVVALLATYCQNEGLEGVALLKKTFLTFIFIAFAHSINHRILTGKWGYENSED